MRQKDCCNWFRKWLIPCTGVRNLSLGQNDRLLRLGFLFSKAEELAELRLEEFIAAEELARLPPRYKRLIPLWRARRAPPAAQAPHSDFRGFEARARPRPRLDLRLDGRLRSHQRFLSHVARVAKRKQPPRVW